MDEEKKVVNPETGQPDEEARDKPEDTNVPKEAEDVSETVKEDTNDYKKMYNDLMAKYSDLEGKYKERFSKGGSLEPGEDLARNMKVAENLGTKEADAIGYDDLFTSATKDVETGLERTASAASNLLKQSFGNKESDYDLGPDKIGAKIGEKVRDTIGLADDVTDYKKNPIGGTDKYDIRKQGFKGAFENLFKDED